MKLINLKANFVVAEFQGDNTLIYDRMLEKEMRVRGIVIPGPLREKYKQKSAVLLSDPEFQKAFKEIYCQQVFCTGSYKWLRP